MFRACVLVLCGAALAFMFASLAGRPPAGAMLQLPPAEPRAPGVAPSAKWLTESPRYQFARGKAWRAIQDLNDRLDLSTTRQSRDGLYRVSIVERREPVTLGEYQSWTIRVVDRDGRPISGATLGVGGGMPRHGHGLPSAPKVSAGAAPGEYRLDGLEFSMPGWWELHVYVSKDRRDDTATFNLVLE